MAAIELNDPGIKGLFTKIGLDQLPEFSDWPARLLGLSSWQTRTRNDTLITAEYSEKWGRLFDLFKKQGPSSLDVLLHSLFHNHFPKTRLIHIGEEIYNAVLSPGFWDFMEKQIIQVLYKYADQKDHIAEMGCGWGRNLLTFINGHRFQTACGGEFTQEGISLGNAIAEQYGIPVRLEHMDYNDPQSPFLQKTTGKVVFSHNSIEQISTLKKEFLLALCRCRPKVVVHFEPVFEYRNKNTLLHLLWKRYTEINDYNRNLITVLTELQEENKLEILEENIHALGLNAFNPGSFIVWKPV